MRMNRNAKILANVNEMGIDASGCCICSGEKKKKMKGDWNGIATSDTD